MLGSVLLLQNGFLALVLPNLNRWIKFCTHLLFYGLHLWADLDRDWRMGSFRPNQNGYDFLVISCK